MNPLYSIFTAGMLSTIPVQQTQTIYVANLSADDERDSGSFYQVTTIPQIITQPVTVLAMTIHPIIEDNDDKD